VEGGTRIVSCAGSGLANSHDASNQGLASERYSVRRRPYRIVLGVNVAHEHRNGLMSGEDHADLQADAGIPRALFV
jgi:hypothetical protein